MKNRQSIIISIIAVMVAAVIGSMLLGGCGIRAARNAEHSGFLEGYYDLLKKGEKGEILQVYKNPAADWPSYNQVLIDPVQIWRTKSAVEENVPLADLQRVANNFHLILTKALSKDYTILTDPTKAESRTMRIQVALTSMKKGGGAMDVVTTIIPIGLGVSAASNFITGKPPFVGNVAIEGKIIDARTGKLLAAGVDKRIGGKDVAKIVNSWDDVNKILEYWSKLLVFRLCQARGEKDCLQPSE